MIAYSFGVKDTPQLHMFIAAVMPEDECIELNIMMLEEESKSIDPEITITVNIKTILGIEQLLEVFKQMSDPHIPTRSLTCTVNTFSFRAECKSNVYNVMAELCKKDPNIGLDLKDTGHGETCGEIKTVLSHATLLELIKPVENCHVMHQTLRQCS